MRVSLSVDKPAESVADLRKKWCCMGTLNIMHCACCVWLLYGSGFFSTLRMFSLKTRFFVECGFPLSIFRK